MSFPNVPIDTPQQPACAIVKKASAPPHPRPLLTKLPPILTTSPISFWCRDIEAIAPRLAGRFAADLHEISLAPHPHPRLTSFGRVPRYARETKPCSKSLNYFFACLVYLPSLYTPAHCHYGLLGAATGRDTALNASAEQHPLDPGPTRCRRDLRFAIAFWADLNRRREDPWTRY